MKKINLFFAERNSILVAIGFVYFWFGILKFFPQTSPADAIAKETISALSFNTIPAEISIILLAILEVGIAVLLIALRRPKFEIYLALGHLACTFTPLLFFIDLSFDSPPIVPTLLGQYILKNIIIIVALLQGLRFRESVTQKIKSKADKCHISKTTCAVILRHK